MAKIPFGEFPGLRLAARSGKDRFMVIAGIPPSLQGINVTHREGLHTLGFIKLDRWGEILEGGLPENPILAHSGVYAVLRSGEAKHSFYSKATARRQRNVINPLSLQELDSLWVPEVQVLYFGAAGVKSYRTLGQRLTQMRRHCKGGITDRGPHKGGEILWQVRGYESFEILALPTEGAPIPRGWECSLIVRFMQITGRLPFANRKA